MSRQDSQRRFRLRWGHLFALAALGGVLGLFVFLALLYWPHQPRRYQIEEEKAFGWFDPHLVLAVVAVDQHRDEATSGDAFLITVQVRNTAASPDFLVDPSPLAFSVRDAAGGVHPPAPTARYPHRRLTDELTNSEAYRRTLRFEVPADVASPELWVVAETGFERFLPSLSRSLLTHKLVFPLVSGP